MIGAALHPEGAGAPAAGEPDPAKTNTQHDTNYTTE